MNFIEELLKEAEEAEEKKQIEVDRLKADQILMAIEVLESKLSEVAQITEEEIKLIEHYRKVEEERLKKRILWLSFNVENYIRTSGEKTIRLPHGELKLRTSRGKIEIPNPEYFIQQTENSKFVRVIPESFHPNLVSIHDHVKTTGEVPTGAEYIPGEIKFSYSLIKRISHVKQQTQTRTSIESAHESEVVERAPI